MAELLSIALLTQCKDHFLVVVLTP